MVLYGNCTPTIIFVPTTTIFGIITIQALAKMITNIILEIYLGVVLTRGILKMLWLGTHCLNAHSLPSDPTKSRLIGSYPLTREGRVI